MSTNNITAEHARETEKPKMMPPQIERVRDELANHLKKFDWSGLTSGRKNILDTFLHLATTEGYAAVTMRSLGKALNVKPPSIYSHFPEGRDEIVAECLRWHYYNFGTAVLDAVAGAEDPLSFLKALISVHVSHQVQKPENDLWDLLVASDRQGHFLHPDIRSEVNYWIDLIVRLYAAAASEYCSENLFMKARIVMSVMDSSSTWSSWDGTPVGMDMLCTEALRTAKMIFNIVA